MQRFIKSTFPLFSTLSTSSFNSQAVRSPLPLSNAVLLLKMLMGNVHKLANFNEVVGEGRDS